MLSIDVTMLIALMDMYVSIDVMMMIAMMDVSPMLPTCISGSQ